MWHFSVVLVVEFIIIWAEKKRCKKKKRGEKIVWKNQVSIEHWNLGSRNLSKPIRLLNRIEFDTENHSIDRKFWCQITIRCVITRIEACIFGLCIEFIEFVNWYYKSWKWWILFGSLYHQLRRKKMATQFLAKAAPPISCFVIKTDGMMRFLSWVFYSAWVRSGLCECVCVFCIGFISSPENCHDNQNGWAKNKDSVLLGFNLVAIRSI